MNPSSSSGERGKTRRGPGEEGAAPPARLTGSRRARLAGVLRPPTRTLPARAVRYGLAGLAAAALYFVTVTGLVEVAGAGPVPAAGAATVLVIAISYVVNRGWVFQTSRSHASAFPRFLAASAMSIALNTGLMYLSVDVLGWWYVAGLALATAVVPPTNFAINYLWCFRPLAPRPP